MPYVDFRLYRSPNEEVTAKDILKLSIIRLLRIRRTLDRYHTADEIIQLLKELQIQYNKSAFGVNTDPISVSIANLIKNNNEMMNQMMAKIDALSAEINMLKSNPNPPLPEIPKQSKTVCLQVTPKDIAGIVPSRNMNLPTIFKSRLSVSSESEESKG